MGRTRIHLRKDLRRTLPRRRPSQDRSEATVEALLEATRQILRKEGFAAATTNRIAQRAGVSVASVYQYFPNKGALVAALIDRHIAHLTEVIAGSLADAAELPVEQGAPLIVRAFFETARDEALHRELLSNVPNLERLNPAVQARRAMGVLLGDWLALRSEVAVPNPRIVGQMLANACYGIVEGAVLTEPGLVSSAEYLQAVGDLLVRYFNPLGRPPPNPRR